MDNKKLKECGFGFNENYAYKNTFNENGVDFQFRLENDNNEEGVILVITIAAGTVNSCIPFYSEDEAIAYIEREKLPNSIEENTIHNLLAAPTKNYCPLT